MPNTFLALASSISSRRYARYVRFPDAGVLSTLFLFLFFIVFLLPLFSQSIVLFFNLYCAVSRAGWDFVPIAQPKLFVISGR
jgi:hypothetical protein